MTRVHLTTAIIAILLFAMWIMLVARGSCGRVKSVDRPPTSTSETTTR